MKSDILLSDILHDMTIEELEILQSRVHTYDYPSKKTIRKR